MAAMEELRERRERVEAITQRLYNKHTVASQQHLRSYMEAKQKASRPKTAASAESGFTEPDVEEVVKRLATVKKEVTDSRRTGSNARYGVVNSYAWRGWNSELPHVFWRYNYPRNYLRSA